MTRVLAALAAVLLVACLALGWLVWGERADRASAVAEQESYGDAVEAASEHVGLLVDLRHGEPSTLEALADGATERLAERYSSSSSPLVTALEQQRSESDGSVVAAGMVALQGGTATVLVAADATVTSRATGGEADDRDLRFRVQLVEAGGRWLVDDLEVLP